MRKLMMKMSISLDGFVAAANGKGDWMFKAADEKSSAWVRELCESAGLHIMGSKSFHDMAPYWPTSPLPIARAMNEIPKAVFTQKGMTIPPAADQSPAAVSWAGTRIFNGDLAGEIRQLKAEPGQPILAHGGAGFMRSLIETGLIDEYHLVVHPVALGAGLPIFSDLSQPLELKLVDTNVFPGGIVVHTYHPA
ncbi:dihydrofolate reductase family protein [Chitinophaga sp. G-6-1-13]|uniref:Dihydrofolate reductase family protein n=1 Tax=Chitinophaga fulva TaxID=2728842 RepID=A0A848GIN5_9BACT|nr:dihydrofolate reductase family protein [Chitinophaga fulva]NML37707.1 dihydrofolate reductase family protein [Chitinophaga fulva]